MVNRIQRYAATDNNGQRSAFVRMDIQRQIASPSLMAGVSELRLIYKAAGWTLPITISVLAPTRNHRGVHMSRLVEAIRQHVTGNYIEESLRKICRSVNLSQPRSQLLCSLEYPYREQFTPITIEMSERGPIRYVFERIGITACPCSKEISGIGHMQRTHLQLEILNSAPLDFEEVAHSMDECFSTTPEEFLKRPDEAEKVINAQENPKFVEDVVRDCIKRFPKAKRIEGRSYESIHVHNARALWENPKIPKRRR
ncbi:MAG: hypothetical protein CMO12_01135 [Thaumarchaeota archaeon]|nr:hypothetical protein [Nitrososphaerota archaeon]